MQIHSQFQNITHSAPACVNVVNVAEEKEKQKKEKFRYIYSNFLEKEMANHSSIAAWKISGTEEPARLLAGYSPWDRKSRTWLGD